MAKEANVLLGVCGLYCGACYHYRASFYDSERLSEAAARRGCDPGGFTCQGCRSDMLYIHPGCARCKIRACADERGVVHCGLCTEFPCDRIKAFQSDGRVHHRDVLIELESLRAKGADKWLVEQAQRWKCECGESYSWYEATCNNCGEPLNSYGADPTVG
jgi:hypothetical protein